MTNKYNLAKIYNSVLPTLRLRTQIIVPINFPKIKPETKAIGEPNPRSNTHIIPQIKNKNINAIKF